MDAMNNSAVGVEVAEVVETLVDLQVASMDQFDMVVSDYEDDAVVVPSGYLVD